MQTVGLEWTVLTWNIQGTKHTDLDRVADVVVAQQPDVVAFQEVRSSQAAELAERLSMSHVWHEKHHLLRPLWPTRAEGAALLTPHRLTETGAAVISDARWKRTYRRRIAQWGLVQRSDASAYRVLNVHLSPHGLRAERIVEAGRVAGLAAKHISPPTIVAGDMNDFADAAVLGALPGIEVLPAPPTNPSQEPTNHLDHVLVPPESTGISVTTPGGDESWAELSDHLPLTVRFSLDWVQGGIAG